MTLAAGIKPDPQWYRDAIFYSVRVRAFYDASGDGIGDLQGLMEKLDYLQDLGVTTLWLLPFYPSPLRDDGYDISDYMEVHPDVGTLPEFKQLLKEAHRRGLRVVTELVLNHTSDQHPWFQRARRAKAGSPERDFYVWSDDPKRYAEARIIFKDFERSNWSWDPVANAYYWHRFYSHQPDLNFENPAVKKALFRAVDFWLEMGVDGLRLDAVPYLYEREGTNCENLPETIGFLQELRQHVDRKFTDKMLLAEANQWPEDAVQYLGHDKCHMAFHFPIMPRMFMALHMEDRFPVTEILSQTPALEESCQWGMFLRNHDELTLEMVTDEERDYMYEAYGKDPTARINLGIRRRLAPLLENNRRKIELLNTLLFSLPGTPILYYGDEIGMGDNIHLGDRNGVRTPMQWSADRNAGFSKANPQRLYLPVIVDPENHFESVNVETQQGNASSLLRWTKRMIALRQQHQVFGRGTCEFLDNSNSKVLAFLRVLGDERILVVANLSRFTQYVELDLSKYQGMVPVELMGNTEFPALRETPFVLTPGPHAAFWFSLAPPRLEADRINLRRELPEIRLSSLKPAWMGEKERAPLEEVLPDFLRRSRWFGGKGRSLVSARVVDAMATVAGEPANILLVEANYAEGPAETYLLPLVLMKGAEAEAVLERQANAVVARVLVEGNGGDGPGAVGPVLLVDAFRSPEFCRSLLKIFARRKSVKGGVAELRPGTAAWVGKNAEALQETLEPRVLAGEQSNTSVVYGDRFILKMYRKLAPGKNPDLEIGRYLTEEAHFPNAPRVAGWLEYLPPRGEPWAVGVLNEFAPGCRDAWEYSREELKRYYERVLSLDRQAPTPDLSGSVLDGLDQEPSPAVAVLLGTFPASAELLGRRTAELHQALAANTADEAFAPEPYGTLHQRSVYQSLRNLAQQVLRQLKGNLGTLPESTRSAASALVAQEQQLLARFEFFRGRKIESLRIRHHGDFHLGQVLHTGKDFMIIDFEGEPARALADRLRKRSAIRDVAGMLRSLHYAAASTLLEELDSGGLNAQDHQRLEVWAEVWYREASRAFLRGYVKTAGAAPFLPQDPVELRLLLDVLLLEKALYEVAYELNNRPTWLPIPLRGVHSLLLEPSDGQ